jgi:DNA-binding PadR family transcriptional regulator
MDPRKRMLFDALKLGAAQPEAQRLYRRGKLHGLFAQRTSANAEIADAAVKDGLLEVTRVETAGKATIEWVRVTQKGQQFLADSESPIRALEELREALAVHQQGLPAWAVQMNARIDEMSRSFAGEIEGMRQRLDQLAGNVEAAIARIEAVRAQADLPETPWGPEALDALDRRKQVGLGTRCPLADLFAALKEKHAELTVKVFHAGLKRLQDRRLITLLPGVNSGDTPGPEYALLDGAAVFYYASRAGS